MKKPILFSVLAVVLVFCYCYWGLATVPKPSGRTAGAVAAPVKEADVSIPNAITPPVTVARAVPRNPVTQDRSRIYDSPNILMTINEVRRSGSQDEKDWAISLLTSCTRLFSKQLQTSSEPDNPQFQKVASKLDDPKVAEQKKHAAEMLAARCRGIDQLSVEERTALKQALSEGYGRNQSTLGQLHAIDGDRWSGEQSKLISESLYGDDPIVARTAFFSLLSAFDSNSPGGLERQRAFTMALGPQFTSVPLSEFERLQGCRSMGWCGSEWGAREDANPNSTEVELANKYHAALDAHADARSILAIR
jgi:hypothetical protein